MLQLEPQKLQALENLFNEFMSRIIGKDYLIVIMPASIGDFIITGMVAPALKKKYNKEIVLLVLERYQEFKIKFEDVKEIVYIPGNLMWRFQYYIRATEKYSGEGYIYGGFPFDESSPFNEIIDDKNLYMFDRFKKNFDIPLNTPIKYPIIEDISEEAKQRLHEKYKLDKDRTIILCPYCSTIEASHEKFFNLWKQITPELNKRGYTVYENIGKTMNNQKDTFNFGNFPMETTLNEIYYIADKVKCFIGMRSGLFDLLSLSKANIVAVSTTWHWYCDLKFLYPESNSRTLYTAIPMIDEMKAVAKHHQVISINISNLAFKNIDNKDLYTTEEEIMASILDSVEKL